jgi:hypothetical protein
MRKLLVPLLPLLVLAGFPVGARCEDEVRAILKRAIAAQGGADKLSEDLALVSKVKGTINALGNTFPFTVEMYHQPGGRSRFTLSGQVVGANLSLTQVLDGVKGWRSEDGKVQDLSADEVADLKRTAYIDHVIGLVALLDGKDFTLTGLGESKANGQPVLGVKVGSKGQKDITLYFAKDSGLLFKYAYTDKDPTMGDKEALHETYLSDYREPDYAAADLQTLRAAKVGVEGPALVDYLRKHVPPAGNADKIKELIRRLGDDSFDVREKASADLVALGAAAKPALEAAAKNDTDTEVVRRAQECLRKIGDEGPVGALPAAVRLVALRKPEGAAEVLLSYVGHATDEELTREVQVALAAVAVRDGKPDKVLEQALEDKDPGRRAAAAAALGRDGGAWAKRPGRRLYVEGVKLPMKSVSYSGGQKLLEGEVVDVQFFNRLDDSLFARPK